MYLRILQRHIRRGRLHVHLPDGVYSFGDGEPEAHWFIRDRGTLVRILLDPGLELGETYMNGGWHAGDGGLAPLLEILLRNFSRFGGKISRWFAPLWRLARQWNRIGRSYRNVARHYDLDEWLFRHFLDRDLQYSCAYFATPGMSLEDAQRAKCRHLMGKLLLEPGQRVLDIGSGWGGLALFLAEHAGVHVTGLTLSREQLRVATDRARERGLLGRVEFLLADYREHTGHYDRIVSVGMFEHVGAPYHRRFMQRVSELLLPDGVAVVHTIGRSGPPTATNAWIHRHIFPGGYIPALSELSRALEPESLMICDLESLRLHYAFTLEEWLRRFLACRDAVAARMGERFCRMWEFYLAVCAAAFRWSDLLVFQLQLAHHHQVVPITRDYLYRPVAVSAGERGRRSAPG